VKEPSVNQSNVNQAGTNQAAVNAPEPAERRVLKIGTRGSRLARAQSATTAAMIEQVTGLSCELVIVRTDGDDLSIPLSAPPRPGAFAARLRDVLLAGEVDIAVHSFKDLPFAPTEGLQIVAVPARAHALDALVSRDNVGLDDLPRGARVGTSSPRRATALLRHRGDLEIVPIRGNVDTRVRKVREGDVDAAILAAAGLERVGLGDEITELIPATTIVPAPAQGALAVEMRADDPLAPVVAAIDDHLSRIRVAAERQVLTGVQATCTTAIGAHSVLSGDSLTLVADLTDHMGIAHAHVSRTVTLTQTGDLVAAVPTQTGDLVAAVPTQTGDLVAARDLGERVAEKLLERP
jgi:hydroxymethylbilane synthase